MRKKDTDEKRRSGKYEPSIESAERIGYVRQCLAARMNHNEIVKSSVAKYSVTPQAAYLWIKKAYGDMEEEGLVARPMRRAQLRESFTKLFQSAMRDKNYGSALGALKEIGRMDGLLDSPTAEISITNNTMNVIAEQAANMTDEELDSKINELLRLGSGGKIIDGKIVNGVTH